MTNISGLFVERLMQVGRCAPDDPAMVRAKQCLLDYLGVTLAGAAALKEKNTQLAEHLSSSQASVPLIGLNRKADVVTAALINGISAHYLELDDGSRYGMAHPGAPVISALLPLLYSEQLSGVALVRGILVGYEACLLIAEALQPDLKQRGYHATGVCGTVGAALGAAFALDLPDDRLRATLAAAATSAAGMLEVIRDQSELKPYNAGRAAAAGLMAASVARAGFKGPDDVLNGAHGFLKLFSESPDLEKLKRPSAPAIHSIYVKPWAACRHSHAPVEAILNLRKKIQVRPEEVESITVFTYGHAVHLHDHTEAASTGSAKMSTPYSVAVALLTGRAGLEQFSPEMIARRDVQDMTRKVAVLEDPEMTRRVPAQRAARVRMIMKSGKQHEAVVELPKGEPEHPLSEEELAQKFTELATFAGKSKEECRGIIEVVSKIEDRAAGLYPFL